MCAIKGDQQGVLARQRPGAGHNAVEKEKKILLVVLVTGSHFQAHAPALFSQVSPYGRIAVITVVGTGHPFLAGLAVVQTEHNRHAAPRGRWTRP